jgi:RNA polymerase sigma-70 factor (ECF subfamily)
MQSAGESIARLSTPESRELPDLDFDSVYEDMVEYVWSAVCRMGVKGADADDVVQEVFTVVYRRLGEFEGRAQLKTWVYKIMVNLVQHYFRTHARNPGDRATDEGTEIHTLEASQDRGPVGELERREALRVLDRLLAQLDDTKRVVFVLAEIEQMTLAEIAGIVAANVNTVASRLRSARRDFDKALSRFHAREFGRTP